MRGVDKGLSDGEIEMKTDTIKIVKTKAWEQGYSDFRRWLPVECSPFERQSTEHSDWLDGYNAAYADSQDR